MNRQMPALLGAAPSGAFAHDARDTSARARLDGPAMVPASSLTSAWRQVVEKRPAIGNPTGRHGGRSA
ncbi:hypothetical protein Dvina_31995 [Dactylosporangium vinaceum]|uniref:Uncharacterized protein n=1 Tax=Dactylosporangium vinaceum TaxID=53362 RepID=A0ABV5MAP6_9ACTN|nr:hypothetical protein [Dactylosporangium vinaceum]UAB92918.1 hypothetical protein Dvina_31995 [Dactylosporangium vinaceum]